MLRSPWHFHYEPECVLKYKRLKHWERIRSLNLTHSVVQLWACVSEGIWLVLSALWIRRWDGADSGCKWYAIFGARSRSFTQVCETDYISDRFPDFQCDDYRTLSVNSLSTPEIQKQLLGEGSLLCCSPWGFYNLFIFLTTLKGLRRPEQAFISICSMLHLSVAYTSE